MAHTHTESQKDRDLRLDYMDKAHYMAKISIAAYGAACRLPTQKQRDDALRSMVKDLKTQYQNIISHNPRTFKN